MGRQSIEEIRRREIIEAFFKVVSEKGLSGATTRQIASAAGCNQGMLRHYFGNKEAIIYGALTFLMKEYSLTVKNIMSSDKPISQKVRTLFRMFSIDRFSQDLNQSWFELLTLSKIDPEISTIFKEFHKEVKGVVKDMIIKGIESGEYREVDASLTASMIYGCLEGSFLMNYLAMDSEPTDRMADHISEVFLQYLKHPAE